MDGVLDIGRREEAGIARLDRRPLGIEAGAPDMDRPGGLALADGADRHDAPPLRIEGTMGHRAAGHRRDDDGAGRVAEIAEGSCRRGPYPGQRDRTPGKFDLVVDQGMATVLEPGSLGAATEHPISHRRVA
jgi:hypothetical protein